MSIPFVINGIPQEKAAFICMQTSKRTCIPNGQYSYCTEQELEIEKELGKQFKSEFKDGHVATKVYNCHGLTLASKRTGIFEDEVLNNILQEEYRLIKEKKDVLEGDVVFWYDKSGTYITHSAIVINIATKPILFSSAATAVSETVQIKCLSKTRTYKEIVHNIEDSPFGLNFKFYRINHGEVIAIK